MKQSRQWLAFLYLGTIAWGSSFLWIKIGLDEIGPFVLVTWRLGLAAVAAWLYIGARRMALPRNRRALVTMLLLGLANTAVPFTLISWAETRIDSGLAGILNGTMPLFTVVIAHLFVADDRFSPAKGVGLVLGFGGMTLLLASSGQEAGPSRDLLGQGAMLLAAILYAVSSVVIRRELSDQHPIIVASVSLTSALIAMAAATFITRPVVVLPSLGRTWLAIAWLGLIGTTGAYLAYFYLIKTWGPTRSTMVTYVFPVVAVALGVLFLGETLEASMVAGSLGIISGILIVNWRSLLPLLRRKDRQLKQAAS